MRLPLHGPISDMLRSRFTAEQILHNPRQPETKPMPKKGVQGIPLKGRKKS